MSVDFQRLQKSLHGFDLSSSLFVPLRNQFDIETCFQLFSNRRFVPSKIVSAVLETFFRQLKQNYFFRRKKKEH